MRTAIETIIVQLLGTGKMDITLDEVGDAIGVEFVSQAEIEELLVRLEKAGRRVGALTPAIREHLQVVLREGRALRRASGVAPGVAAIAEKTGLSVGEVRAALLYASVLSR